MSKKITGYLCSNAWFNFCRISPAPKPNHTTLFLYLVDLANSLGFPESFGVPTVNTMEIVGIKNRTRYYNALKELQQFSALKIVYKSENANQATIIMLTPHTIVQNKEMSQLTSQAASQATSQALSQLLYTYTNSLNLLTIQTLERKGEEKDLEIENLTTEVENLNARIKILEAENSGNLNIVDESKMGFLGRVRLHWKKTNPLYVWNDEIDTKAAKGLRIQIGKMMKAKKKSQGLTDFSVSEEEKVKVAKYMLSNLPKFYIDTSADLTTINKKFNQIIGTQREEAAKKREETKGQTGKTRLITLEGGKVKEVKI